MKTELNRTMVNIAVESDRQAPLLAGSWISESFKARLVWLIDALCPVLCITSSITKAESFDVFAHVAYLNKVPGLQNSINGLSTMHDVAGGGFALANSALACV